MSDLGPPTHVGRLGFVPVWAWYPDGEMVLAPRYIGTAVVVRDEKSGIEYLAIRDSAYQSGVGISITPLQREAPKAVEPSRRPSLSL